MNFTELKEEFYARGTDYLSEDAAGIARAERWLNDAYREILNLQAWPFLQALATGPAPLSVPDLRKILTVSLADSFEPLQRATEDDLIGVGLDLNEGGTPGEYYLDGGSVKTYPVDTGRTINVRYIRRVEPLTGTDVPIFDEEYHNLIVDRAMIKAYLDSDNFESAAAAKADYDANVTAMAEDYLLDSRDPVYIIPSGTDL